jgi:HEAT repeat protein
VTATKDEIGERVDALAQAHDGDEFVAAVQQLAEEVGPAGQPLLREVLLERAAAEEDFQRAISRRFGERRWAGRTFARFERLWRDDRADAVAAALGAGEDGSEALAREVASLREDRGRSALVLDELSRHADRRVRAWVPGAAADLLGDGGTRLVLSLTRDREPEVRVAAVSALVSLGPKASQLALPDLRRRLHSSDPGERIAAMQGLAEAGDGSALGTIEERAEAADLPEERQAARAAAAALRAGTS